MDLEFADGAIRKFILPSPPLQSANPILSGRFMRFGTLIWLIIIDKFGYLVFNFSYYVPGVLSSSCIAPLPEAGQLGVPAGVLKVKPANLRPLSWGFLEGSGFRGQREHRAWVKRSGAISFPEIRSCANKPRKRAGPGYLTLVEEENSLCLGQLCITSQSPPKSKQP